MYTYRWKFKFFNEINKLEVKIKLKLKRYGISKQGRF